MLNIFKKISKDKLKYWYYIEWGKAAGQRRATGIYTWVKPKNQIEKNYNKEASAILETKKSQLVLDQQSVSSEYVPAHRVKANFLDFYSDYIKSNPSKGNRHLPCSYNNFKTFIAKDFISPKEINEDFCEQFRNFLLKKLNGETPANYFMRFKRVLKAAKKEGYFRNSPAEDIAAKSNNKKKIKNILNEDEYIKLMKTPCSNYEVEKAFVFSLYTGLRWVDVAPLTWENIRGNNLCILQHKTGVGLELPIHEIALRVLGERKTGKLFYLPTQDGANKVLRNWCSNAKLGKHITWHCARHSFSVLLQGKGVDLATVAGMLGHTTTKYVQQTYKRYLQSSALEAIQKLPIL